MAAPMATTTETPQGGRNQLSAYQTWMADQGIPIHRGYFVGDLRTSEVGWWEARQCHAAFLELAGQENISESRVTEIKPRQDVQVQVTRKDGSSVSFTARCRIDTYNELEYFRSGGILQYVLRKLAA